MNDSVHVWIQPVDTRIVTNHYSSWNLIIVGLAKIPTVAIPQSTMEAQ